MLKRKYEDGNDPQAQAEFNLLGDKRFTDDEALLLKSSIEQSCAELHKIKLSSCGFSYYGLSVLAQVLPHCPKLAEVSLSDIFIDDKGATVLAKQLQQCKLLSSLKLEKCFIGSEGMAELADALNIRECPLDTLILRVNTMGPKGLASLTHPNVVKNLVYIDISWNRLRYGSGQKLGRFLKECNRLETLNIEGNFIGDSGVKSLANAVTSLATLKLGSNSISPAGVLKLATVLPKLPDLKQLNLDNNPIGDVGVEHLTNALKDTTCHLVGLNLANTNITDDGAKTLASALVWTRLTDLNLDGNGLTQNGVKLLQETLPSGVIKL